MSWLKLHTEIYTDPKLGKLSCSAKWQFIEMLCICKDGTDDGYIASDADALAWQTHKSIDEWTANVKALIGAGIVEEGEWGYYIPRYAERQTLSTSDQRAATRERVAKHRAKNNVTLPVTPENSVTGSVTQPLHERYSVTVTPVEKNRKEEKRKEESFSRARETAAQKSADDSKQKEPTEQQAVFGWLKKICVGNYGAERIGKSARALVQANCTQDERAKFERWWSLIDWRGKRGDAPTPEQVWQEFPKSRAWDCQMRPIPKSSEPVSMAERLMNAAAMANMEVQNGN